MEYNFQQSFPLTGNVDNHCSATSGGLGLLSPGHISNEFSAHAEDKIENFLT